MQDWGPQSGNYIGVEEMCKLKTLCLLIGCLFSMPPPIPIRIPRVLLLLQDCSIPTHCLG